MNVLIYLMACDTPGRGRPLPGEGEDTGAEEEADAGEAEDPESGNGPDGDTPADRARAIADAVFVFARTGTRRAKAALWKAMDLGEAAGEEFKEEKVNRLIDALSHPTQNPEDPNSGDLDEEGVDRAKDADVVDDAVRMHGVSSSMHLDGTEAFLAFAGPGAF